jgi:hypothetical protein
MKIFIITENYSTGYDEVFTKNVLVSTEIDKVISYFNGYCFHNIKQNDFWYECEIWENDINIRELTMNEINLPNIVTILNKNYHV